MADIAGAGGVFLVSRQLLDPNYKPHVYQDDLQRLAMVRLIAMARWSDNGELRRGQIRASVRQLAERCRLSPATMGRFLQRLEADGAIERKRGAGPRDPDTITLLGYDAWQGALGETRGETRGSAQPREVSASGETHNGTHGADPARETRDETRHETHGETPSETQESKERRRKQRGRETRRETHDGTQGETHGETTKNEGVNERDNSTPSGSVAGAPEAKPKSRPKREPWSTAAGEAWAEVLEGEPPYGRIGRALKPLVVKFGEVEVLAEWKRYLEGMTKAGRAGFATPEDFAARYGYYREHGVRMPRSNGRHRTTEPQEYVEQDPNEEVRWKR